MEEHYSFEYILELVYKKRTGTITAAEDIILQTWEKSHQDDELVLDQKHEGNIDTLKDQLYDQILTGIGKTGSRRQHSWKKYAIAASLLIGITTTTYYYFSKSAPQESRSLAVITPGRNEAYLTLDNGEKISLNKVKAGKLAIQQETIVSKNDDGTIIYSGAKNSLKPAQFNSISTPRGGQWPKLQLPDGTIVILDAASTVRYPVAFNGNERVVELTGQAYFEVAHDAAHPFRIIAAGHWIEDIGTAFNVNAYPDEEIAKTTLVQGSVRIKTDSRSEILVPGEQAVFSTINKTLAVKKVDVTAAVAWKDGQTSFKDKTIAEIMRQISRWYDVDIIYEGLPPDRKFSGSISRQVNLDDLIKVLEFQDMHIERKGKKLIVKS